MGSILDYWYFTEDTKYNEYLYDSLYGKQARTLIIFQKTRQERKVMMTKDIGVLH